MNDQVLQALWENRVRWSLAASALKQRIFAARTAALALSSTGAIAETVTTMLSLPGWRTAVGGTGAVCLAAATFVTTRFITTEALQRWTRARAVSEGIKHLVYQYQAQITPFRGPDGLSVLSSKVHEIEEKASDLRQYLAEIDVGQVSPPGRLGPEDYVQFRVRQQIDHYYRPEAQEYAKRLRRLRGVEILLSLVATGIAAATAFLAHGGPVAAPGAGMAAWVAVLTTLGGAITAHLAANRYDFLVMSYYATAGRLQDLLTDWNSRGSPSGESEWTTFVLACEGAISVENESWMAKWAEQRAGSD